MEDKTKETIEEESTEERKEQEDTKAKESALDSIDENQEADEEIIEASSDELNEDNDSESKEEFDENGEIIKTKFDVFGLIGFISGIAALIISVFGFGIFVFWIGIVFSCIGRKSIRNKKFADYGLLFSIFSFVIAILLFIFL